MRRLAASILVLAAALGCRGPRAEPAAPAPCAHLQSVREVRGIPLCEDVWTCSRPPGGPFDRVGLRRLAACEGGTGPVVLYLPGMHMNGELPVADPRYDLRLYLAQAGARAWAIDYRTHVVPAGAGPKDLETLAAWTADVFAQDVIWAAGFVRETDKAPVHLAGFSFGAGLAYRVAARRRDVVAGLIVLDGTASPARAPRGDGPALDVAGGRLPFPDRQQLLGLVAANPRAPSPLPGYPTAGDALAEVLWSAPSFGGQGGLSDAKHGVSDVQVLARLLASYDRWWPRAALEGDEPKPPATPLALIAFASTNMGAAWLDRVRTAARAFGGADVRVRELPGYGHLDVLVGRNAARQVFEPVRSWLAERVGP